MNIDLIDHWKAQDIKPNQPASDEKILHLMKLTGFRFPDDFISYLKEVNGFGQDSFDKDLITFWPIDLIITEFEKENTGIVNFADYLNDSHRYGFLNGDDRIYIDYPLTQIADNFSDFIDKYLNEPNSLI